MAHAGALQLLVSQRADVGAYSVRELWRSLTVLVERFDALPYSDELRQHVDALHVCCGKFMAVQARSPALFNEPLFCAHDEREQVYRINEAFLTETECVFDALHRRLHVASRFAAGPRRRAEPPSAHATSALRRWLREWTAPPHSQFVEREFRARVFDWHVRIGERERHKRARPTLAQSARAVLSASRPAVGASDHSARPSTYPIIWPSLLWLRLLRASLAARKLLAL